MARAQETQRSVINGQSPFITLFPSDPGGWGCSGSFIGFGLPLLPGTCTGVTVNLGAGTVSFSNTVLDISTTSAPPITLNGPLTFPPF